MSNQICPDICNIALCMTKHYELYLAPQIRLNSSNILYKAFISEVHVLCLRSNVEVMEHFENGNKIYRIRSDLLC